MGVLNKDLVKGGMTYIYDCRQFRKDKSFDYSSPPNV